MRYSLVFAVLAGCAPIHPQPDAGTSFAIQHLPTDFWKAMEGAHQHCARMGLEAQHVGTDRIGIFTAHGLEPSWFECVQRSPFPNLNV